MPKNSRWYGIKSDIRKIDKTDKINKDVGNKNTTMDSATQTRRERSCSPSE
jgi:hypothetical protein